MCDLKLETAHPSSFCFSVLPPPLNPCSHIHPGNSRTRSRIELPEKRQDIECLDQQQINFWLKLVPDIAQDIFTHTQNYLLFIKIKTKLGVLYFYLLNQVLLLRGVVTPLILLNFKHLQRFCRKWNSRIEDPLILPSASVSQAGPA